MPRAPPPLEKGEQRLLYSNLLATSIFNETPEKFLRMHYFWAVLYQAYWYEIEMKRKLLM